jgi:hypothetical protein
MKAKAVAVLALTLATASHARTFVYRETTGGSVESYSETDLVSPEGPVVRIENAKQIMTARTDSSRRVWKCEIVGKPDSAAVTAQRTADDRVTIRAGASTAIKKIDGAPWYVSMNALSDFVKSERKRREFWVISADFADMSSVEKGVSMLKLAAVRKKPQRVSCDGATVYAIKIVITFADWRSLFWHADYWYRPDDGVMVRSEQVRGGPGTPTTVVELVESHAYPQEAHR